MRIVQSANATLRRSLKLQIAVVVALASLLEQTCFAEGRTSPPGDKVDFVLDDGTAEADYEPILIEHFVFNAFTPLEFPIELNEVQVWRVLGEFPHQVAILSDMDQNIPNGADLLRIATLPPSAPGTFASVTLDPPVFLTGPGDIWIAIVPSGDSTGLDQDGPQANRSYYCGFALSFEDPCYTSGGVGGNLMMRAFGIVSEVPVELQSVEVH